MGPSSLVLTSVDDSWKVGAAETPAAVLDDSDSDTPVRGGRAGGELGRPSDCAGVLVWVGAAKSELAVGVVRVAADLWLEVDPDDLGRDCSLTQQVVRERRDQVHASDRILREADRAETENAIDFFIARGRVRDAERLICHRKAGEAHLVRNISSAHKPKAQRSCGRTLPTYSSPLKPPDP
jgi:hypothetical protein